MRSSIAPRKPERTASMRGEKDGTFEVQRRRPIGQYENIKPGGGSSCSDTSSYLDGISKESDFSETESTDIVSRSASNASDLSSLKAKDDLNTLELNSSNSSPYNSIIERSKRSDKLLNDNIKNSVQKMSSTIDSYLKDKSVQSVTSTPITSSLNRVTLNYDSAQHLNSSHRASVTEIQNTNGLNLPNDFDCDKSEFRKSDQIDLYTKKFTQGKL